MNTELQSMCLIPGIAAPVSQLALGTAFFTLAEKERWFSLLDGFVQAGGTLIDSARIYGDSEAVVGAWLDARGTQDQTVLITKGGHGSDAMLPAGHLEEVLSAELDTSLKHLRTDCVDLYMLHRDNPCVPVARVMDFLNGAIERERIRAIGASNWTYARVMQANEYTAAHGMRGFTAVSNNLSLAVPAEPFYPGLVSTDRAGERWHAETGIPLIAWSSQARGFFTGRYTPTADVADTPFAQRMVEVYGTKDNLERLDRAVTLGKRQGGYSAVQVALAWVRHKPFPVVPVIGPRTLEELASCIEATDLELTDGDCKWLNLER